MNRGTRKLLCLLCALSLILCALPGVSAGQQPATPSDLDPVDEEIRRADRAMTLEDESVVEGRLRPSDGAYVYRVALDVKDAEKVYLYLMTDAKVTAVIARKGGAGEKKLAQTEAEDRENWKYEYKLEGFDPGKDTVLVRITSDREVSFSLTLQTETCWRRKQQEPTPTPKVTDGPGPTDEPTPTPSPAPTEEPQHDPDPTPTATPEPTPSESPVRPGGGGGGRYQPHARNRSKPRPDYDHVSLEEMTEQESEPMHRLTLGEETLDLSLRQGKEDDGMFTASVICWREAGSAGESAPASPDTLILTASGQEGRNLWSLDGAVLRKLNRSGIEYLVLRDGDAITVMKTEGFLAGWVYDELKSRGTAGRRFEYTVETDPEAPAVWRLSVEGAEWELTADESAGIRLTEVYEGTSDALKRPPEELTETNGEKEEKAP